MNVIWLVNMILPDIARHLELNVNPFGGWLDGLSKEFHNSNSVKLHILFPQNISDDTVVENIDNITYIGYNLKSKNVKFEFRRILNSTDFDVIHIFGTEYKNAFYLTEIAREIGKLSKIVVSIQGLISVYSKYYYADLPIKIIHHKTVYEIIRRNNIFMSREKLTKRGIYETKILENVTKVIGRTQWDFACIKAINPDLIYYKCNESLRDGFYLKTWSLEKCKKFSIFISQGNYPIKGLHILLEALKIVINKFPLLTVKIAGDNIIKNNDIILGFKKSTYAEYLKTKIIRYKLQNNIVFTGVLSEIEVINTLLSSHVFISPSSIENSPNSVGEAMIMGVPTISSYVGGVTSLMNPNNEGLYYPFNDSELLAFQIMRIFNDDKLARYLSTNARVKASLTHDRNKNYNDLISIYSGIQNE